MLDKLTEKIGAIGLHGIIHYNETKRFNDNKFSTKENLFKYRISKIKVFLGEKDTILGLQTVYKNLKGEEIFGDMGRDQSIKEINIKTLETPSNDFLCQLNIWVGNDNITKLKFGTRKGLELIVGTNKGEDKNINELNNNKDNIILCFSGGYGKSLEALNCKYFPMVIFLSQFSGYFELKKKLKNNEFKEKIKGILNKLNDSDKVLFKVCCLPEKIFNEIIKYCYSF